MRKVWSRIFILCMACMICMSGLCLAKIAPDEVLTGINTANTTINGLVGEKPVYINFWASWCDPCVGEMRAIAAMYQKYGDRVRFAAVSIDDEAGKAPAFVRSNGLTFPVYMGDSQKISTDYQMDAIPRSVFIGTDGNILEEHVGAMTEQELDRFLARNLTAPTPKTDVTGPRNSTPMDPAPGVDRQPGTQEPPAPRNTPQSNYSPAAEKQIPENAPHWGNSSYAIYTYSGDSFTWEQAEQYCENMGGHLVTITSPQEQAFIEQLNSDHRRLWIGAHRPDGTYFAWVTGEPWSYTNWDEGEPSNKGVGGYENCVVLWPRKWNDLRNDNSWEQSGFICEWDD